MPNSNRVLRLPEVLTVCGLSRSAVYLKIQQGAFPPPIKLGARSVGWIEEEIQAWINQRINEARGVD